MRGGEQSKEAKQPKRKVNDGGNAGGESADLSVYAELKDYKPLIWRRFQVAGNITLAQLGYVR